MEEWEFIEDFETYAVSDQGRVKNVVTGRILKLGKNQRSFTTVGLQRDRILFVRSVAQLVAKAFVAPAWQKDFDCVIHLDFDRDNNEATNLLWRPRWFAIQYYLQANDHHYNFEGPIVDVESGETYSDSWEIVQRHGVLNKQVVLSIMNGDTVYPIGRSFDKI